MKQKNKWGKEETKEQSEKSQRKSIINTYRQRDTHKIIIPETIKYM